jgi:hypothetical protein
MDNGSGSGKFGMSLSAETELIENVASAMGVTEEVSRIALEAAEFDYDSALDLLMYGQRTLSPDVQMDMQANANLDLAKAVVLCVACDLATAEEALKASNYDVDAAIDMITWYGTTAYSVATNNTCCGDDLPEADCQISVDMDVPAHDQKFEQGQFVCYTRTDEMAQVITIHPDGGGGNQ